MRKYFDLARVRPASAPASGTGSGRARRRIGRAAGRPLRAPRPLQTGDQLACPRYQFMISSTVMNFTPGWDASLRNTRSKYPIR